jgi:hypothetical protein
LPGLFVFTWANPSANDLPLLSGAPPVVLAAAWAVLAFVWVWFMEGVFLALRAMWRRISPSRSN